MSTVKTHRGRPAIYTRERISKLLSMVKQSGRTLKAVIASVNSKNGSNLRYVPCLVAMARLKMNLRRK